MSPGSALESDVVVAVGHACYLLQESRLVRRL